jgi:hypothetical protein
MNMPVEVSPDQPALGDAHRDSAEAAQRDLSEFLATCDAPPPLAADAPPQAESDAPPDFAPSDFARASDGTPSVSPDRGSAPDPSERAIPELHPHSAPAHRDAVTEACERAARLAAQATIAASDTSKQVAAAIPSGVAVVASMAAEAEPLQAARVGEVVAPPDADRAPAWEPAQPPPDQPVIAATTEVGKSRPEGAPAQADEPSAPVKPAARHEVSALVAQGKEFFAAGDLVAARILFMRAAKSGDAAAAVAMGTTYDPVVLAERGVRGAAADLDEARAWYERAKDMGSSEGPRRLEMLANR